MSRHWRTRQAALERPVVDGAGGMIAERLQREDAERRRHASQAHALGSAPPPARRHAVFACSRCASGHYLGVAAGGLCRECASG